MAKKHFRRIADLPGPAFVIAPLVMTQLFRFFSSADAPLYLPGAPFLAAAALSALALPPFAVGRRGV